MKRLGVCGFLGLMMVIIFTTCAWSYTLSLEYFDLDGENDSNKAYAYARVYSSGNGGDPLPSGPQTGAGKVEAAASRPVTSPIAGGYALVRPAAVLAGPQLDANYSIITTVAKATLQNNDFYDSYGQGFGDSMFGFQINSSPGEANQVMVTLGFKVDGTTILQHTGVEPGEFNQVKLDYAGFLYGAGPDRTIVDENKTWQSLATENFTDAREIRLLLATDVTYTLYGVVEVTARTCGLGMAYPVENSGDFDAFMSIQDIQAAPLPGSLLLLAGGLIGLAGFSRKR